MDFEQLGQALRAHREAAGLSQAEAADAVGINRVQLAYYESGTRQPPLTTVGALASLYGLEVGGLIAGAEAGRSSAPRQRLAAATLFRAAPELQTQNHAATARFLRLVEAYIQLLMDLELRPPGKSRSPFPPIRGRAFRREAARLAREVRNHFGLGSGPVGDLHRILDEQVLVFRLPLGDLDRAPSGFFCNHPDAGFCIVVNTTAHSGRQLFTLAHEVAHAYFHSQSADAIVSMDSASGQSVETFANIFAAEFLVPADGLAKLLDELDGWASLSDAATVIHLQQRFGVSYEMMLLRLRQQGLLAERDYDRLRDVSPRRLAKTLGYRSDEEVGRTASPLDALPYRMLRLVRTALDRGVISIGDASETFGVSREEIARLEANPLAEADEKQRIEELERVFGFVDDQPRDG